ncbi:MAG TPA: MFS transporter [Caulobacteraceae bacterium]|jgi:predicted MFS family arabinose efflux permease|nr:MFS transporter [Caulobacteraceae bacterium]
MEDQTSPTRPQGVVVLGFGLGQIVAFASSFYLMGVLGDAIGRDLHLSPTVVFSMVSLSLAVPAFIAPAVAKRIDAEGGRRTLLSSHVVFAIGLALVGIAPNAAGLAAGMLAIGLGMAYGLSPTPFAILVSLYGETARRPITGVALIGGLGSTLGWPLTGWFADELGWRGACFLWAGVHLAILPLIAWVCPHTPGHTPHAETEGAHPPIRWDRPMIQLAILFACAWFVSTCMSAHLPRLLTAFGLTMPQASAAAGLMGIAAVTVRFLEFTVLRKLPPIATTRVATLMHPAGAAALLALGGAGGSVMAMGQGAGNGMLTVAKGVLPLSLYGPRNYAYRSALLGRPALFAQIAGPAVYALALERSATLALVGSSALCLVMFAMTFGLVARGRLAPSFQRLAESS